MRSHLKITFAAVLTAVGLVAAAQPVMAQTLRRDLASYFVLAQRKASLKNITLDTACNVGVNCGTISTSGSCGTLIITDGLFADGSQIAGDRTSFRKEGASIFDLFRNEGGPLDKVTIRGSGPTPFTLPIIPNTCTNCTPDVAAIEAACGFPTPYPSCDPAKPVKAAPNSDCSPLALDVDQGNGQCDLAPGTYGNIIVTNDSRLSLEPGDYPVCSFRNGRGVHIEATGARLLVDDAGSFRANNNSEVGDSCGDLVVFVKGKGQVSFGRNSVVAAKICAPESVVKLGHSNVLIGQFIGDVVNADRNNSGQCCGGRCACYDQFTPTTASVGAEITATGACDMTATTEVRVCGHAANITSKTALEIKFEVPVGAAGACNVEFVSPSGTFLGFQKLTVN